MNPVKQELFCIINSLKLLSFSIKIDFTERIPKKGNSSFQIKSI